MPPIARPTTACCDVARPLVRVAGLLAATAFAALAGCASLPAIEPDLIPPRAAALPIDGAHGPLSAPRARGVLARLAASAPYTGIFDRHLAREEALTGSPLTAGNDARLLQDGPATYAAMLEAIAGARDHVNLETYILEDDEVGRRFADALLERQAAGVQVNLLRDSAGTFDTPAAFFQRLVERGVRVLEFNPVNPLQARREWLWNRRDHRKLLIVDGRVAFLGGINISSVYSGGSSAKKQAGGDAARPWRDTDLRLEGPVVAELQKMFLATWSQQSGAALPQAEWFPPPRAAGRELVRAIGSAPEEPYSQIYETLLSALDAAQTSVHITVAYFAPDPQLLEAFEAAAGRGVDVRLILPAHTDSWLVFHAGRRHYDRLLSAGVRIFERRDVILHSKTALVDGVWATIGSTNLDWRSFLHNREVNAVVLGTGFGAQVQAMFERDLENSDEVTLAAWRSRGPGARLAEWFAAGWEYWL